MNNQTFKLSNGVEMPQLGLGTYPMMGDVLNEAIFSAYEIGYRLIDTADNYWNEEDMGNILHSLYEKTDAKREDMFLVTKLSDELYHPKVPGGGLEKGLYFWKTSPIMQKPNAVHDIVNMRLNNSLKFLRTDYIDLWLMHWPFPDYFQEVWYEMEQAYKAGKVRAIGVCNCRERHLEMLKNSDVFPMVNQFETSPLNTKCNVISYCNDNNVRVMVYSPLMSLLHRSKDTEFKDYVDELCVKYVKNDAQIVLRYNFQRGLVSIPKSSHKERLRDNADIFDFQLTDEEMQGLSSFNIDLQSLTESYYCPGI